MPGQILLTNRGGIVPLVADLPVKWFNIDILAGATYETVEDFINTTVSAGLITGCVVSDNGDGTVASTAGTGMIKTTDSATGDTIFFDVDADASITLTDENLNYVYVDYNSGSPIVDATIDISAIDHHTQFVIAIVFREGTDIHISSSGQKLTDFIHKVYYHAWEADGIKRASGMVTSETGTLQLSITAGVLYWALERIATAAFDSSGTDTFGYYYRDGGGGWTLSTGEDAIDDVNYDDNSGAPTALTAAHYGVHWVYMVPDGSVYVVYGQDDYLLAAAETASAPGDLPPELANIGTLIAKIIVLKSAGAFAEVLIPWDTSVGTSAASDHGGLAGLLDDDHTQYILANGTRGLSGDWDAGAYTISCDTLAATDGNGLQIHDDGGTLAIFVEDGGSVGIGPDSGAPVGTLHLVEGAADCTIRLSTANTGKGAADGLYVGVTNADQVAWIWNYESTSLVIGTANNSTMTLTSGHMVGIRENSNTFMTIGLVINQLGNDDEILAFKSSDVNHPMTDYSETDTWGAFAKAGAAAGGVEISGYSDTDNRALWLRGYIGSNAPTVPCVNIRADKWDGVGTGVDTVFDDGELAIVFNVGSSEAMSIFGGPQVVIGNNSDLHHNSMMTQGLTLYQAGNDDEILAFKSSDVAHALVSQAETDTYAAFDKASNAFGGLKLQAFAEDAAATQVLVLRAFGGTADTTKSTAADGLIAFMTYEHDGANNIANVTANGNILVIKAQVSGSSIARWILDEDGDTWQSGVSSVLGTSTQQAAYNMVTTGYGYRAVSLRSSDTDDAPQGAVICGGRRAVASTPFSGFGTWDSGTTLTNYYGGGNWGLPDAMVHDFYTQPTYIETANQAVRRMYIGSAGLVCIGNENANTGMTVGLTINQAGNDDEILAFKSSDIAHGMTAFAETDTYCSFQKRQAGAGGLRVYSLMEDAAYTQNIAFYCFGGTATTTQGTSAVGLFDILIAEQSGGSIADVTANGVVFSLRVESDKGGQPCVFGIDEDGDTWQSGNIFLDTQGAVYVNGSDAGISFSTGDDQPYIFSQGSGVLYVDWQSSDPCIGLGATAIIGYGLRLYQNSTPNQTTYGVYIDQDSTHTSTGAWYQRGIYVTANSNHGAGVDCTGDVVGLYAQGFHKGAGTIDLVQGIYVQWGNYTGGSGTVDVAHGIKIQGYNYDGTISAGYSLFIADPSVSGGSITSEWAIYSLHEAPTRLQDILYINTGTANGNMTKGITIQQGANDNELLTFKSTDVAHGMTDFTDTDSFAAFGKNVGASGGLLLEGFSEAQYGLQFRAAVTSADTTKTTAGAAAVNIVAYYKSGTGATVMAADGNILAVRNYTTTVLLLDEDGDLYVTSLGKLGGGAPTTQDHGTATNPEIVSVVYGTGSPPAANTTPIGTLFIQYTA